MRAGDCWIIQFEHSGPKAHLWFLLVDPQPNGMAVIASVTTLRHNADQTVIRQPAVLRLASSRSIARALRLVTNCTGTFSLPETLAS